MTDQEFADLNAMKQRIQAIKDNFFNVMRSLDRLSTHELEMSGYGGLSNAEAMRECFQRTLLTIANLHREHTKKYPDCE